MLSLKKNGSSSSFARFPNRGALLTTSAHPLSTWPTNTTCCFFFPTSPYRSRVRYRRVWIESIRSFYFQLVSYPLLWSYSLNGKSNFFLLPFRLVASHTRAFHSICGGVQQANDSWCTLLHSCQFPVFPHQPAWIHSQITSASSVTGDRLCSATPTGVCYWDIGTLA